MAEEIVLRPGYGIKVMQKVVQTWLLNSLQVCVEFTGSYCDKP